MDFMTPKKMKRSFANLFTNDSVVAKNVASFPFSNSLGATIPQCAHPVSGIAIFNTYLYPGTSTKATSSLNTAARAFFNYVTQGYTSTNANYEASDLEIYNLAVAYVFAYVAELKRVYGVIRKYSPYNDYYGKALVTALGYDYEAISHNLANFRAELNVRIARINQSLVMMPDFKLMEQWVRLVSEVYTDGTEEKHQLMAFKPVAYGQYSATEMNTGGCIRTAARISDKMSFTQAFQYLDSLLDPLRTDSDINQLSGVILRVYGDACPKLSLLTEDYTVSFMYDPATLKMIHNMRSTPVQWRPKINNSWDDNKSVLVYQSGNVLYSIPSVSASTAGADWDTDGGNRIPALPVILDFPYENPTPEECLEALALSIVITDVDPSTRNIVYGSNAIVNDIDIFRFDVTGSLVEESWPKQILQAPNVSVDYSTLAEISKFDWHPLVFIVNYSDSVTDKEFVTVFGDLCNYTVLSTEVVATVHDRVQYALLNSTKNLKSATK